MIPASPYSHLPPRTSPRGKQRQWRRELTLPPRIELYAHGLVERNIAAYGFWIWNLGESRLLLENGGVAAEGKAASRENAELTAISRGLLWLEQQGLCRRPVVAHTDDPLVYELIARHGPFPADLPPRTGAQLRAVLGRIQAMTLKLVSEQANSRAIQLATQAYVRAQEVRRQVRVEDVLHELRLVGQRRFVVGNRYQVDLERGTCTCPDFRRVHSVRYPIRCKHLLAAEQVVAGQRTSAGGQPVAG